MNAFNFLKILFSSLIMVQLLVGCAATSTSETDERQPQPPKVTVKIPPAPVPVVVPPNPADVAGQNALREGVELYNKGQYTSAVKFLANSKLISDANIPIQLEALKYIAFSYCLTRRQTQCRQQFEKAFKLDPAFDLLPGEKGHPMWTPAFEHAKKAK